MLSKIYYEFRHKEPITEPKLDYQLVINTFNHYGFELIKDYSSLFYKELENNNWSKILKNTKSLFFTKKNPYIWQGFATQRLVIC